MCCPNTTNRSPVSHTTAYVSGLRPKWPWIDLALERRMGYVLCRKIRVHPIFQTFLMAIFEATITHVLLVVARHQRALGAHGLNVQWQLFIHSCHYGLVFEKSKRRTSQGLVHSEISIHNIIDFFFHGLISGLSSILTSHRQVQDGSCVYFHCFKVSITFKITCQEVQ